jgi:replicative DNA helicase
MRVTKAANDLLSLQLVIDETPRLSIAGLRGRAPDEAPARHQAYRRGPSATSDVPLGDFNRVREISQGLKVVARELNVPVIAVRSVRTRRGWAPPTST